MKVFVTGVTGHVGEPVARRLAAEGHEVTGLLRSAGKRGRLADAGVRPVFGDMTIPASYRSAAREHDALIHCAFRHEGDSVGADRTTLDALLDAARLGDRPRQVVYTSGCWVVGDTGGETVDEDAPVDEPAEVVGWRPRHEQIVLDADGEAGIATAVVRPGLVYGGAGSLTGRLFATAVEEGAAEIPGDGDQHWSFVHREDLAGLYARVLAEGASGVFHGVDGVPVPAREAARAAAEAAGAAGRVRVLEPGEAREELGAVADALRLDQRLSGRRSAGLGWGPERPCFPEAADEAFREWRRAR